MADDSECSIGRQALDCRFRFRLIHGHLRLRWRLAVRSYTVSHQSAIGELKAGVGFIIREQTTLEVSDARAEAILPNLKLYFIISPDVPLPSAGSGSTRSRAPGRFASRPSGDDPSRGMSMPACWHVSGLAAPGFALLPFGPAAPEVSRMPALGRRSTPVSPAFRAALVQAG